MARIDVKNTSNKIVKPVTKFFATLSKPIAKFCKAICQYLSVFFKNPKAQKGMLWFVVAFAIVEIVFAVLIYGFRSEDKVTRIAAKIVPFPIAVANQDFVSYNDYLFEKDYIHHFYSSTQQTDIDLGAVDAEVLNQLIENKLIQSQAKINRISVSKAEVDASIQGIIDQNGGEDKVVKVLSDLYGLNLKDFRGLIETQMLREKVSNELIAKVTVRHILIKVDANADQATVDAAKAKIDGIRTEIVNGLDFSEAATKYSEDTGSADNGGLLDAFAQGEMVKEFSDAAFATEVGQISEPIKSDFGWHIIKVESKTGKIQKSFTDWLDSLESKSLILKF
jgi:foldase protein PrsA